MRCLIVVICIVSAISSFAQKQTVKVPPFRIIQADGTLFKAESLPMGKPIIVIYFSPDCDHCKAFTKDLLQQAAAFKKASLVLITCENLSDVKMFMKQFGLANHRNFYVGTEGSSFFVRDYYNVLSMPFVALHNKNGDLVQTYQKDVPMKALIAKLEQLDKK